TCLKTKNITGDFSFINQSVSLLRKPLLKTDKLHKEYFDICITVVRFDHACMMEKNFYDIETFKINSTLGLQEKEVLQELILQEKEVLQELVLLEKKLQEKKQIYFAKEKSVENRLLEIKSKITRFLVEHDLLYKLWDDLT
ncbi:hypothetical protein QYM36_006100, partial [Artemia franciscana]